MRFPQLASVRFTVSRALRSRTASRTLSGARRRDRLVARRSDRSKGLALPAVGVASDAFLRLTIVLLSLDRETTPVVHGFSLSWECAGD